MQADSLQTGNLIRYRSTNDEWMSVRNEPTETLEKAHHSVVGEFIVRNEPNGNLGGFIPTDG